jgi:hypothetical protein
MRTCGVQSLLGWKFVLALVLPTLALFQPSPAQIKPTGAPLELSSIETEQEVPLAILTPDGKTAKCVSVRLHWISKPDVGPNDDAASFTIDLPSENPAAPIFTAQLWNASLASALAWQQPWQGARWKVLQTPETDGTGIDAALAVGMIATSARRPYPPKTVVIGHLNPDGSLGPVPRLVDRVNAAAREGMTRIVIPSVQRFDTDATGETINIVRHAGDLHVECIPVDDLKAATEVTMNDPLPDTVALDSSIPKYSNDVSSYIDDFAHHEQNEAAAGMGFAPKESDLPTYPPRLAAVWKSVYADFEAGQQAYSAGQVYVAYQLFVRVNGRMTGANALAGQTRASFDVKTALQESDDLHDHLHILMNPPTIDRGGLESAVLVAEMADWAYEVNAALEGAQLVTKQAFSQRSDATDAEKDRAREAILFANEQCKYLLTQATFYTGLLGHIAHDNPITVDANASHLLPQLIPAQLATARSFTDGIRASDLRDALLFDPRLVAYVNVLRQAKADWDAHLRKQESDAEAEARTPPPAPGPPSTDPNASPVKLNSNAPTAAVGFDPGNTYQPPHMELDPAFGAKKLSNVALCLIWVNNDCEIATLDEKYLRLSGTLDAATHEWHVKDRPKLDALLQMAEIGAREGIAFAEKTEIDPSVLAMIYEKAAHERTEGSDASALDALRNYWRCALLGNMCWQLAHTHKAQPVVVDNGPAAGKTDKPDKKEAPSKEAEDDETAAKPSDENTVVKVTPKGTATTNVVTQPAEPAATAHAAESVNPPVAPIATNNVANATEPPAATNVDTVPVAPAAPDEMATTPGPATTTNADTVPVAPAATNEVHANKHSTLTNADTAAAPPAPPVATPLTNQAGQPVPPPAPPVANTPATNAAPAPSAPPTPPPTATASNDNDDMTIPVAPIAKATDYTGGDAPPATNAAPVIGPIPPSNKPLKSNADGGAGAFP